jgi:hypothetical protein
VRVHKGDDAWNVEKGWPLRYNWNIVESGVKHHKHSTKYIELWLLTGMLHYEMT